MLSNWFNLPEEEAVNKIDKFEIQVKKKFIEQP
jgi:hypothetical protein